MNDMTPRRRMVDIAGSRLSVIDEGEGPAVLLGHGYLWDWRMWAPQIEALKADYRLIVPEMWGHGESGPLPEGTARHPDLAAHMLELMDRLEIERFALAGSSMGGMWGAHLAALAPNRITGFAMLNSYLGEEPEINRQTYFAMLANVEREGLVNESIIANIAPLFFAPGALEASPDLATRFRDQIGGYDAKRLRESIVPLGRLIFGRENALDILKRIEAPMLIIAGREDRSRPAAESVEMAGLTGAIPHVIGACGHSSTIEQPTRVNGLLSEFLAAIHEAPGSGPQRMLRV